MSQSDCLINTTFASNFFIEIYSKETPNVETHKDLAVKLFYNNIEIQEFSGSLDNFEDMIQNRIRSGFNSKCGMKDLNKGGAHIGIQIFSVITLVFMLIVLICLNVMLIINARDETKNFNLYLSEESQQELMLNSDKKFNESKNKKIQNGLNYNDIKPKNSPSISIEDKDSLKTNE